VSSPPEAQSASIPSHPFHVRARNWLASLSLRARIIFLFVALLIVVQGSALLLVTRTSGQIARSTAADALERGERIFERVLKQNQAQLEQGAAILAADFGFRAAVATNDMATLDDALRNHGARINADAMLLVAPDLTVRIDTLNAARTGKRVPFPGLFAGAQDGKETTAIVVLDDKLYQMVPVPVRAPDLVAWVALGFLVDDNAARDLKQVAALDVSFISRSQGDAVTPARLHASTLQDAAKTALLAAINNGKLADKVVEFTLTDEVWEIRQAALNSTPDARINAVLQRPLSEAQQPFYRLNTAFMWLSLGGVILSLLGSVLIARRVTQPIRRLGEAAQRIESGDYDSVVPAERSDEIGALASTLDHMRAGIAHREREMLRLAYEDGLTGLPNRSMFIERVNQAIKLARRDGRPPAVMLLDLDRFKTINDTLGHPVGDQVLREAGQRISSALRESDTVARLGGDEFAILLVTGGPERPKTAAQRILQAMEAPIVIDGQSMDVGASIGIAYFPEHGEDASALMRAADVAMYVAKRGKIGFADYDPSQDEQRQSHLTLLGELRRAVDNNELKLMYQPKLTLADGRIAAAEALVRWHHPQRGMVPPNEFIPFAEQTGYIARITRWVVGEAVAQCGLWRREGLEVRLSINASTRDLQQREDLAGTLQAALDAHDVPARLICVEITESALMDDPKGAQTTLKQLHDMGITLSIDDYGTGYSSLAYLKELTVNELKIDRSFVVGMQRDAQSLAIVRSTIELGHNLGLQVVAEGVENESDIATLKALGCDAVQGYCVARPLAAAQFPARAAAAAA